MRHGTTNRRERARSLWAGTALLVLASACGANGRQPQAGTTWCQDRGGDFHFLARVPPLKYRAEYKCVDGDYQHCNEWQPTGRYVFVVTDVPFINWETELVTILYVEKEAERADAAAQDQLQDILNNDKATLLDSEEPIRQGETKSGLAFQEIFWQETRGTKTRYDWRRRDVFIQGSAGSYHLAFLSVYSLDRPDIDEIIESFQEGPAPDEGQGCPCLDEHAGEAVPCGE